VFRTTLEAKELAEHAPNEQGVRFPINLLLVGCRGNGAHVFVRDRRQKKKRYIKLLFFEAAEERAGFACPEAAYILKAGVSQPFHLVVQRWALAVEIDEAAAAFD
jgi:hypothetical protein